MKNVRPGVFNTLVIDLQKGIFELNGKSLPFELSVDFACGIWQVKYTCHEHDGTIEQAL